MYPTMKELDLQQPAARSMLLKATCHAKDFLWDLSEGIGQTRTDNEVPQLNLVDDRGKQALAPPNLVRALRAPVRHNTMRMAGPSAEDAGSGSCLLVYGGEARRISHSMPD